LAKENHHIRTQVKIISHSQTEFIKSDQSTLLSVSLIAVAPHFEAYSETLANDRCSWRDQSRNQNQHQHANACKTQHKLAAAP